MELFIIFFSIIFFFFATLGYGNLFIKIVGEKYYNPSLGEIGYLGFFTISLLVLFFHFFLPLNLLFNSILYSIGFAFFLQNIRNNSLQLTKYYKFLLTILFLSILMFIKYKPNEDFGYYHLPYITNLIEEKIIFGLSNLQLNQGWNSIWLNIKSTYHVFLLNFNGIFFSNIVFYLFTSLIFYEKLNDSFNDKKSIFILTFCLFFLIFLNSKFSRLNSFGLDVPSNFLLIYIFVLFFLIIQNKEKHEKSFRLFEYLVIFCLFSISFRIINVLILILPLIFLIKYKIFFIKIFRSKIIFAGILFFLFFSAQQIIYTGCFLIPNNLTCITNFSWFDPNIIENFITDTTKVNKSFQSYEGDLSREEYLANFNWVKNWYLRNKIELFEHVGTFLVLIIVYIFFLGKRTINNQVFNSQNNLVLLFILIALIMWFLNAPVVRFGTIYIQSLILILIINVFKKKIVIQPKKNFIYFLISISFLINFIKNTNRIVSNDINDNYYPTIPQIVYKTEFNQNIPLNSPISNPEIAKSELCWNVKALCRMGGFSDLEVLKYNNYIFIKKTD